jgi:hypothetical protein
MNKMKSDLKLPLSMVFDHESEKQIPPKEDDQFFCEYSDMCYHSKKIPARFNQL